MDSSLRSHRIGGWLLAGAAAVAWACVPAAARAQELERALLKEGAPEVVKYLDKEQLKSVGVLKFMVRKGNAPLSDNVGPLNNTLANRLELALELELNKRENNDVAVLAGASKVAREIKGANHLTEEGRAALFTAKYPTAWGNDKLVEPDAFVTGCAVAEDDLRDLTVGLVVFTRKDHGAKQVMVARFTVKMESNPLIELGESGSRGLFDNGKPQIGGDKNPKDLPAGDVLVSAAAGARKDPEKGNPALTPGKAPVLLEIHYGNRVIRPELKDGKAQVPEPNAGEAVSFVLTRNDDSKRTYGVVLMVNGINTLDEEKGQPAVLCRKWILEPKDPPLVVEGFCSTKKRLPNGKFSSFPFTVSSPEKSRQNEVNYGDDVGTISFTVFANRDGAPTEDTPPNNVVALQRGVPPAGEKVESLDQLSTALRRRGEADRGLIEKGAEEVGVNLQHVQFTPEKDPVLTATIAYYKKSR
jgi:hypothetical protein